MTLYAKFIIAICCVAAYLIGSIPFGLILGKLFGAGDIRKIGSGNIGATNMLRTGRKGLAAATLLLDFAKGVLAVAIAQGLCNYFFATRMGDFIAIPDIQPLAGLAVVLGHIFPIWLGFKGGKGVATTLGVLLATEPFVGVSTLLGWLMIFYLTRVSSLAAIGSIICAPLLGYLYATMNFTLMAVVLALIVVYKHKENIRRLREGKETKWEKKDGAS